MKLQAVQHIEPGMLPTKSELHSIRPGSFVRLQLLSGTRFWVMTTSNRRENNTFSGCVEQGAATVKRGDEIIFGREHVYEII